MSVTSFESVDGYGLTDIAGSAVTVGPVRLARKVLQRTTFDLARHATYSLAIHGHHGAGGAAALNHQRGDRDDEIIGAFRAELESWSGSTNFRAYDGLGLTDDEVGGSLVRVDGLSVDQLNNRTAVAAAGSLADREVTIASAGDEADLLALLADQPVASVQVEADLAGALSSDGHTVFVRGRTGIIDHDAVAGCAAARLVGLQPLTTTARGLAVASRQGSVVVPDFISAAGAVLGAVGVSADELGASTIAALDPLEDSPELFVAACVAAEDFMRTWTGDLPFGRPLAP